jgi:hypothetical protein
MPSSAGGWVNLSDYMAANKDAGQEMSAAGSAEVEKRRVAASQAQANVARQQRQSGRQGGSTDPSQQAGYTDYAKAQAGVQDAAHLSAGGSGNIWDAAIASPSWNADRQAQGAYSQLQSQLAGGTRSAERSVGKGQDWNKQATSAAPTQFVATPSTVVQGNATQGALNATGGGAAQGAQDNSASATSGGGGNAYGNWWSQLQDFFGGR